MVNILVHVHSGLRWLVLIGLILAIINALGKTNGKTAYTGKDKSIGLFALITTHLQFVIGILLYVLSPKVIFSGYAMKDSVLRFFLVEHISLMLLAIVLITIGYSKAKRATSDAQKFKTTLIFYLLGLIFMLASIPWPFRNLGAAWF